MPVISRAGFIKRIVASQANSVHLVAGSPSPLFRPRERSPPLTGLAPRGSLERKPRTTERLFIHARPDTMKGPAEIFNVLPRSRF